LRANLRASYVVKKAPDEGMVMRMTEPTPWYRPL
jgi:hypothetical protein